MPKKLTAIFLFLLLAFNAVGFILYYWSEIKIHKTEAHQLIEQHKYLLSKSIIKFYETDEAVELSGKDEIKYQGRMYDIIETGTENGIIVYFTYSDGNEDTLMNAIALHAQTNSGNSNTTGKKIILEIVKFVSQSNEYCTANNYNKNIADKNPLIDFSFYLSPQIGVLSPPPKCIS